MSQDFNATAPRRIFLANFSIELISQIVAIVDAWDVGRLACSGDRKLVHLLSGARHIRHLIVDQPYVFLPSIISTFENLKSLTISKYPMNSERVKIGDSAMHLLQNLPKNMDSLRLAGVLNPFEAVLEPCEGSEGFQFRYRDLTSLELEGSHRKRDLNCSSALGRLPPNLTRLSLALDLNIQNTSFCDFLPSSLTDLRLHYGQAPFLGPWMARLPNLTSLRLEPGGRLQVTQKAVSALPASLTRLDLGCSPCEFLDLEIGRWKGPLDSIRDQAIRFFANLPPGLLQFDFGGEIAFEKITMLPLWSNLRFLSINTLDGVQELPPELEYLFVLHPPSTPDSSLSYLPKSLRQLEWAAWAPSTNQLKELPNSLEYMFCSSLQALDAAFLPLSLTHLRIPQIDGVEIDASDVEGVENFSPFLQSLPRGSLSRISNFGWWTWIQCKTMGKFVFDDIGTLNSEKSVSASDMLVDVDKSHCSRPFSGLGGSGWTSLGHAIALDSVSLAKSILDAEPSLWYELSQIQVLQIAVSRESWKILNWLESKGKLGPWAAFDFANRLSISCVELSLLRKLNSSKNDPSRPLDHSVAEWLLSRGFRVGVANSHQYHVVLDAVAMDRVDTVKLVLRHMGETWAQLGHPDVEGASRNLKSVLLEHALVNKAPKSLQYLQDSIIESAQKLDESKSEEEDKNPIQLSFSFFPRLFLSAAFDGGLETLQLAKHRLEAHDVDIAKSAAENSPQLGMLAAPFKFSQFIPSRGPATRPVGSFLFSFLRETRHQRIMPPQMIQWFLDEGFVTVETKFEHGNLIDACISMLLRWILQCGKSGKESRSSIAARWATGDETAEDDQLDSAVNEERLIELLFWLQNNGVDLSQLRYQSNFKEPLVPQPFDVRFVAKEFPTFQRLADELNKGSFEKDVKKIE